ncbi:inositol monophosphatase [bacterium]|nr:inositol monophosphatase [bacterium]
MDEYLNFGVKLAKSAGAILKDGFRQKKRISKKKGRELVTEIDLRSEKFIIKEINAEYPNHSVLAEETAHNVINGGFCWVIDPLDGTNNYAHDFPFFCMSIGLLKDKNVIMGIIFDPLRDELFYTKDGKSFLNENLIQVSQNYKIEEAILATGFPYGLTPTNENNLDLFAEFTYKTLGIRRAGSAALDLAYVACGRMDGFWELKLKAWDMAAGSLIVQNAGGISTDFYGNPWRVESDRIVAANPEIHREMINIVKDTYSNKSDRKY